MCKVPPLTKKLPATDTCWKKGNQVFSNGLTLGRSTELLGRPHAQHKSDPRFCFVFVFVCVRVRVCVCTHSFGFALFVFWGVLRKEVEMARIGEEGGSVGTWERGKNRTRIHEKWKTLEIAKQTRIQSATHLWRQGEKCLWMGLIYRYFYENPLVTILLLPIKYFLLFCWKCLYLITLIVENRNIMTLAPDHSVKSYNL